MHRETGLLVISPLDSARGDVSSSPFLSGRRSVELEDLNDATA